MKIAYSHADENLLDSAIITIQTGTILTGYGTDALRDGDLAKGLMVAGTSLELRFEFVAPVVPAFAALLNSNLTVAATLEGRSSGVWGSAEVGPFAFAIPTVVGRFKTSPFLNLTGTTAKQYWRLVVTSNAAAIVLGELWLGSTYRTIDSGYSLEDAKVGSRFNTIRHLTNAEVELAYRRAGRREGMAGSVGVTAAELAQIEAWIEANDGDARPSIFVPRDDVNHAWMVRPEFNGQQLERKPHGAGGWLVDLPLRQLSPGVGW